MISRQSLRFASIGLIGWPNSINTWLACFDRSGSATMAHTKGHVHEGILSHESMRFWSTTVPSEIFSTTVRLLLRQLGKKLLNNLFGKYTKTWGEETTFSRMSVTLRLIRVVISQYPCASLPPPKHGQKIHKGLVFRSKKKQLFCGVSGNQNHNREAELYEHLTSLKFLGPVTTFGKLWGLETQVWWSKCQPKLLTTNA